MVLRILYRHRGKRLWDDSLETIDPEHLSQFQEKALENPEPSPWVDLFTNNLYQRWLPSTASWSDLQADHGPVDGRTERSVYRHQGSRGHSLVLDRLAGGASSTTLDDTP